MAQTFACGDTEKRRVTVSNCTARYVTWRHAGYRTRYDSVSRTLCGRKCYDPWTDGDDWRTVDCRKCLAAIARLNRIAAEGA